MRGKIVVVLFVVVAVAFAAYGAWFIFSPSPVDQRFNLDRQIMPASIAQDSLLPTALDDFKRAGDVTSPVAGTSAVQYVNNSYTINFAVAPSKGNEAALNKPTCQDASGEVITHTDSGHIPYSYSICPAQKLNSFQWINGDWLFTASGADPEAVLRFVNLYGY